MKSITDLRYIHQDHLTGTAVVTSANGTLLGSTKYYPYGVSRNSQGTLGTDKLFTGQRLDDTGLYYYGARYYDATIGRFISADTFVPWSTGLDVISIPLTVNIIPSGLGSVRAPQEKYPRLTLQAPVNPQDLNRYSYVVNNPSRYTDPSGWDTIAVGYWIGGGALLGDEYGGMLVIDDKGNYGWLSYETSDPGLYIGASVGGGIQISMTSANTIFDLEGISFLIGGSGTWGVFTIGGEYFSAWTRTIRTMEEI